MSGTREPWNGRGTTGLKMIFKKIFLKIHIKMSYAAATNVPLKMQKAIQYEVNNKNHGWYGFSSGKNRPRRVPDSTLELGWTAWVFPDKQQRRVWYNVYSEKFQTSKPSRESVKGFERKCPGCDTRLDISWCSQYCSRSCMYRDMAGNSSDSSADDEPIFV
jgi:hypothetical protein